MIIYSVPPLTTNSGVLFSGLVRIFSATPSSFEPSIELKFLEGNLIEKNGEPVVNNSIELNPGVYCSQWIFGSYEQVVLEPIACETVIEVTAPTTFQQLINDSTSGVVYRDILNDLRVENTNLTNNIALLEQLITGKDNIIAGLNDTITELQSEILRISSELSLLKIEYDDYRNSMENQLNLIELEHQEQVEALNLAISYLQQDIEAKNQIISDLQQEIDFVKEKVHTEGQLDNYMGILERSGITDGYSTLVPDIPKICKDEVNHDYMAFSPEMLKHVEIPANNKFNELQEGLVAQLVKNRCKEEDLSRKLTSLELKDLNTMQLGHISDDREKDLLDKLCKLTDEPDDKEDECPPCIW